MKTAKWLGLFAVQNPLAMIMIVGRILSLFFQHYVRSAAQFISTKKFISHKV